MRGNGVSDLAKPVSTHEGLHPALGNYTVAVLCLTPDTLVH